LHISSNSAIIYTSKYCLSPSCCNQLGDGYNESETPVMSDSIAQTLFDFDALIDVPVEFPTLYLVQEPSQKQCVKCGEIKDLDQFHKWKRSKDGHRAQCKQCRNTEKWELSHDPNISSSSKYCTKCHEIKSIDSFDPRPSGKPGYRSQCNDCRNAYNRARYIPKVKDLPPDGYKRCSRCNLLLPLSDFFAASRNKDGLRYECKSCICYDSDYHRNRILRSKYGITPYQYDQMLESQGGVCAVCHLSETGRDRFGNIKPLGVDHNHDTGQVRGLLCHGCNASYGFLREDPEIILSLLAYHEKYSQS